MYKIFHWIFTISCVQRIWIFLWIRTICPSNVHNFSLNFQNIMHSTNLNFFFKSWLSAHLMYIVFHWISSILFIQRIWILFKYGLSVHQMHAIFHWIFTISYIQQIRIFPWFRASYISTIHKFPLNFHDILQSTNSNSSTNFDFLYTKYAQFSIEFSRYCTFRVCLDRTYFAETENWKHCSKIIFKCINSIVGPIFNEKVDKKWSLWDPWIVHLCIVHKRPVNSCGWRKKKKKKEKTQTQHV